MKFAVHENKQIEATPEAKGACPGCGSDMVAGCGTRRVWHWASGGNGTVTIGGRMRPNGTATGKIVFQRIGKRSQLVTMTANFISPTSRRRMGGSSNFSTHTSNLRKR